MKVFHVRQNRRKELCEWTGMAGECAGVSGEEHGVHASLDD